MAALTGRVGKLLRSNADVSRTLTPPHGTEIWCMSAVIRLMAGVRHLLNLVSKNVDLTLLGINIVETVGKLNERRWMFTTRLECEHFQR